MPFFVIQEHKATKLHWDFRLEMNGVLKSWVLPKIPTIRNKEKRLAIQVEDHDLAYGAFEGKIKEGYGKGMVKIWDIGDYDLLYQGRDKIEFELKGKTMKGKFALVNVKLEGKKENWLLMKL